jgi:hypothetical protein
MYCGILKYIFRTKVSNTYIIFITYLKWWKYENVLLTIYLISMLSEIEVNLIN